MSSTTKQNVMVPFFDNVIGESKFTSIIFSGFINISETKYENEKKHN